VPRFLSYVFGRSWGVSVDLENRIAGVATKLERARSERRSAFGMEGSDSGDYA
jgi:hypothetical protein